MIGLAAGHDLEQLFHADLDAGWQAKHDLLDPGRGLARLAFDLNQVRWIEILEARSAVELSFGIGTYYNLTALDVDLNGSGLLRNDLYTAFDCFGIGNCDKGD
jgi:hypothetical protein